MFYILIVSGLWYPTPKGESSNESLVISIRVLVVAIAFFVGFMISLFIVNKWLVNTNLGYDYAGELIEDEIERRNFIKENVSDLKHNIAKHEKKTTVKVKTKPSDTKTKK